jgi:PAS domain S-box-containing protein
VLLPQDSQQFFQGALIAEYAQDTLDNTDLHGVMLQAFTQMILSFQERWQHQKNVEENERKTKLLADLTIEALIIHTDGFAILVNQSFCNLFGYQEKEILGRKIDFMIHPDDYPYVRQQMQKEKASPYEVRFFHKNKTIIWVEIEAQNFTLDGKTLRVAAIRDIRQRKDDQKRMRSLLTEKETLLREVHHRIKNNMSTMMGLLSLQADAMTDQEAADALLDARGRMQSMSVLYEKLYHGTHLESLSVRIYLESLIHEVLTLYSRQDITVKTDIEDVMLPVEVLSPLGILCNEIFTNSIKHGFQGSLHPGIEIRFFLQDQLGFLHIREQGVNVFAPQAVKSSEGFGMILIQALTDQLNAKPMIDKQQGWSYTFEIPLGAYVNKQSVSIVYDPHVYQIEREIID